MYSVATFLTVELNFPSASKRSAKLRRICWVSWVFRPRNKYLTKCRIEWNISSCSSSKLDARTLNRRASRKLRTETNISLKFDVIVLLVAEYRQSTVLLRTGVPQGVPLKVRWGRLYMGTKWEYI